MTDDVDISHLGLLLSTSNKSFVYILYYSSSSKCFHANVAYAINNRFTTTFTCTMDFLPSVIRTTTGFCLDVTSNLLTRGNEHAAGKKLLTDSTSDISPAISVYEQANRMFNSECQNNQQNSFFVHSYVGYACQPLLLKNNLFEMHFLLFQYQL